MKVNQNLPITSNKMTGKPLQFHIVLEVKVENTVIIQAIEAQINSHNLTQNLITVIVILNHRVEVVHHNQYHQTHRTNLIIALDHNQLIIIEMEIVHDDHSRVIDFVTSEIILNLF